MHLGPSQAGGRADGAGTRFRERTLEVGVPRVFLPLPAAALPEPGSKEGDLGRIPGVRVTESQQGPRGGPLRAHLRSQLWEPLGLAQADNPCKRGAGSPAGRAGCDAPLSPGPVPARCPAGSRRRRRRRPCPSPRRRAAGANKADERRRRAASTRRPRGAGPQTTAQTRPMPRPPTRNPGTAGLGFSTKLRTNRPGARLAAVGTERRGQGGGDAMCAPPA